ncbi:hypothetical protein BC629DRAFT_979918 [Irpex lacteus]|nr:hypothetical protein BC629DRAFT_979918 [Irpex lacteus]
MIGAGGCSGGFNVLVLESGVKEVDERGRLGGSPAVGSGGVATYEYLSPSSAVWTDDLVLRISSTHGTPRPSTGTVGKVNLPLSGVGTNDEFELAKEASRVRRGVGKDASRVIRGVGRGVGSSGGVGMYAYSTWPPPPELACGTRYGRGTG